jgi:hypothetical protein
MTLMNTSTELIAKGWLAVGLMVTMTDPADCERIDLRVPPPLRPTLTWRRVGLEATEESPQRLLLISGPRVSDGNAMRAVLHPVPRDQPPWSLLAKDDQLIVGVDGRTAGSATVAWIAITGAGLAPGKLTDLIRWCHGAPVPDF